MIEAGLAALGIVHFGLFCAAVLLLNLTPGPDTAYIVGQSIAQGRRAGLLSALGISAGCCVHTLATVFGLAALYNGAMAWVAGSLTQRMRGTPRVKAWLERAVGAAFVALGGTLALPER